MRRVKKIMMIVLVLLAGWWVVSRLPSIPSLGNLFKPKKVIIDSTPVLLEEIKPLAQLVTISAYDELVADSTVPTTIRERLTSLLNPFKFDKVYTEKKLVVIGKSMVHVGIDLEKLTNRSIQVVGDSIHIYLPPAEVLDVIVNPSGTEIFLEQGHWDPAAVEAVKQKIQWLAVQRVKEKGLLQQSEAKARSVFTQFFIAAGFKKVGIDFRDTRLM